MHFMQMWAFEIVGRNVSIWSRYLLIKLHCCRISKHPESDSESIVINKVKKNLFYANEMSNFEAKCNLELAFVLQTSFLIKRPVDANQFRCRN